MSPNLEKLRALQLRVWELLTPDWKDFHDFVRKVPNFEPQPKPRSFVVERYSTDEGCSCSVLGRMAPCSFCTSLSEEEADIFWNGGMQALLKHRDEKE